MGQATRAEPEFLVPKAQDGSLFEEIYTASFDSVWRYFARMGLGSADTQDLVQEVFLAAYRSLDRYDPTRTGRAWVMGIAVNVGKHHWRKVARSTHPEQTDADSNSRPPNQLEVDGHNYVSKVLAELSAERREIVELHVLEQHSLPEVASILGLPVNTVYSRFRRARLELKDRIDQLENAEVDSNSSVKGRILAAVLTGGGVASASGKAVASTAIGLGLFAKLLPGVLILSVVATGAVLATRSGAVEPAVESKMPTVSRSAQEPSSSEAIPVPDPEKAELEKAELEKAEPEKAEPERTQSPESTKSQERAKPKKPSKDVEPTGERALIEQARSALQRNNGPAALRALTAHQLQYPKGSLKEEAHVLRVQAMLRAGRKADARIEALRFLEIYPTSKHRLLIKELAKK